MIRFGMVSDTQYCNLPPQNNRYFRNALGKLRECIDQFNRLDLQFVVDLGDKIDRDWVSFDRVMPVFDRLHCPVYHLAGNHDFAVADDLKSRVRSKMNVPTPCYYSFDIDHWRFVMLDGNTVSTYAHREGSRPWVQAQTMIDRLQSGEGPHGYPWNGAIDREQLAWLDNCLDDAAKSGQQCVIMCHFPVFPDHTHNLLNADQILEIIRQYAHVKCWFNGHNHRGHYGKLGRTHYITLKGMVDTPHAPAFSTATLYQHHIHMRGFGRESSRLLRL